MTYPNVAFKDAVLEMLPGGSFQLQDPASHRPVCPIQFHNRKAARNWAHGRGFRIVENAASVTPPFPKAGG